MDNIALIQSYLKSKKKSVTKLVKAMGIGRNTFYYQLNKEIPDEDFIKKFNIETGVELLDIIGKGVSTDDEIESNRNVTNKLIGNNAVEKIQNYGLSSPTDINQKANFYKALPAIDKRSETTPVANTDKKGVPYYDIDFMGGFDLVFNSQEVKPSFYIDFLPFNDCDCWINVTGKSMGPMIAHGDIVGLKAVPNWHRFLLEGEIYAIVTDNGFRTIKMLGAGPDKEHYTLIPYNKSEEYQPQVIPKEVITHIFRVKGNIKKFF